LSYPGNEMDSHNKKPPHSVRRLMIEALLLGIVMSVLLVVLQVPTWAAYLAGVPLLPLLAIRLPRMDTKPQEPRRRESKH
jgi:hypothetical protein